MMNQDIYGSTGKMPIASHLAEKDIGCDQSCHNEDDHNEEKGIIIILIPGHNSLSGRLPLFGLLLRS